MPAASPQCPPCLHSILRFAVTTWFYRSKQVDQPPAILTQGAPPVTTKGQDFMGVSPSLSSEGKVAGHTAISVPPNEGSGDAPISRGKDPADGSIFVSIASYRDPETRWTVWDLFRKAKRPDQIHVGIVWQVRTNTSFHV